jgi:hypothetical protein
MQDAPQLCCRKGFAQPWKRDVFEKRLCFWVQRIAREQDETVQQLGVLGLEFMVKSDAIEFRHTQITEDEIEGLALQFG